MATRSRGKFWIWLLAAAVIVALWLLARSEGFQDGNTVVITTQRCSSGKLEAKSVSGPLPANAVLLQTNRLVIAPFAGAIGNKNLASIKVEYVKDDGQKVFTELPAASINAAPTKIKVETGNGKPVWLTAPAASRRVNGDTLLPVVASSFNTKGGLIIKNIDISSVGSLDDFIAPPAQRAPAVPAGACAATSVRPPLGAPPPPPGTPPPPPGTPPRDISPNYRFTLTFTD